MELYKFPVLFYKIQMMCFTNQKSVEQTTEVTQSMLVRNSHETNIICNVLIL